MPPRHPPTMLPSDHAVALFHQAGAIRRAAARLESWARSGSDDDWPGGPQTLRIQRELSAIRHNLTVLEARFGEGETR